VYELPEPKGFFCSMRGGHIFGFSGGQGNKFLFSGTPGDSSSVNEESIARDGMPTSAKPDPAA